MIICIRKFAEVLSVSLETTRLRLAHVSIYLFFFYIISTNYYFAVTNKFVNNNNDKKLDYLTPERSEHIIRSSFF